MAGRVLIVDDDRAMCDLLETDLKLRGLQTRACHNASAALEALKNGEFDVVLTDVRMPGTSGLQLCEQIVQQYGEIPVLVMTAFGNMETAIAALRAGAYDFITKPVEMDILAAAIRRAIQKRQLQEQVRRLSEAVDRASHFGEIIGDSPVMQGVFRQMDQVASADSTILLTGESGTGKELVARSVHRRSRRASGPFVAINCAAIPEPLMESELFGHAKGAFTDARSERKGFWEQADGGTLLLDEIGDMPLSMQAKILRALETQVIRPVGFDRDVPVDVRIIAATNRDLEAAIESEKFRADLYYRINVFQIELPALRSRGADVLLLAQHFVETYARKMEKPVVGIAVPVAQKLMVYNWPGNVRELRNVIERAVALTEYERLELDDLPEKIRDFERGRVLFGGDDPKELVSLEEVQRRYIAHVLDATGGNQTQAARILGVDRKTLYRKRKD